MPKAKLKLSKAQAERLPAAHSLCGTSTADAFPQGDTYHVTVSGRSTEQLYELGGVMATITDADVKAFNDRKAKADAKKAEKTGK